MPLRARRLILICVAAAGLFAGGRTIAAEDSSVTQRRNRERVQFTDAQIVDGFMKIAFGAEFHVAGRVDRIRKFDGPVRIFIDSRGRPDRRAQLARVVSDIGARVQHLDIGLTGDRDEANLVATLVRDRDLRATIGSVFGQERSGDITRSLDPQCLSGFAKDDNYAILRGDVILTVDRGEFIFLDCAYEELLQSLGPINDTSSVPWTMFNDDVSMGYFDVYDQYVLNILYHPRIRPGMTSDEAKAVLPEILPDVRAFVAATNHLPTQGQTR